MLDFLLGMAAGHILFEHGKENAPSAEQILEHEQTKVLIEIVKSADAIEKTNPSPELLAIQLEPLKMMFDRIDADAIKSPEGITVYQQVRDYFGEYLPSNAPTVEANDGLSSFLNCGIMGGKS